MHFAKCVHVFEKSSKFLTKYESLTCLLLSIMAFLEMQRNEMFQKSSPGSCDLNEAIDSLFASEDPQTTDSSTFFY